MSKPFGDSTPLRGPTEPAGSEPTEHQPVVTASAPHPRRPEWLKGRVDHPATGPLAGDLVVMGWTLAEDRQVRQLVLTAEETPFAHVLLERERADVAGAFPEVEHALMSGFRVRVPARVARDIAELSVLVDVGAGPLVPLWTLRLQTAGDAGAQIPDAPSTTAAAGDAAERRWGRKLTRRRSRPTTGARGPTQARTSHVRHPFLDDDLRVVALISAFNEADIIGPVLDHLARHHVWAYVIDNGSTDGTVDEITRRLNRNVLGYESLAPFGDGRVLWKAILARKVELARELGADWYIHHDADEIREGPWPGVDLRDAIESVGRLGYTAIDFRVFNFPPVDDGYEPGSDPRRHFVRWEDPAEYDVLQRKCWKAGFPDLTLDEGGHDVRFHGRSLFPLRFLLCHYPIRGQAHGARKVLQERNNRFAIEEVEIGWHRQYSDITGPDHLFLRCPAGLAAFDLDRARLETLLEDAASAPRPADEQAAQATLTCADVRGVLERVSPQVISGWALSTATTENPVSIELWDGAAVIAHVTADLARPDLAERGFGDGSFGGFALRTPRNLLDGRSHWIWATVAGSAHPLERSPLLLHTGGRVSIGRETKAPVPASIS